MVETYLEALTELDSPGLPRDVPSRAGINAVPLGNFSRAQKLVLVVIALIESLYYKGSQCLETIVVIHARRLLRQKSL